MKFRAFEFRKFSAEAYVAERKATLTRLRQELAEAVERDARLDSQILGRDSVAKIRETIWAVEGDLERYGASTLAGPET